MLPPTRALRTAQHRRAPWRALATGACVVSLLLTGCSSEPQPAPTTTVVPDATADKVGPPEPVLPPTWALTGVQAADIVNRPALAVKVENSREARPQTGLEAADVVWEEMVEGGVPRFIAVYHSQIPEAVGPIRSVRPMDANIIAPLRGIMAFSGGQPPFVQAVSNAGLQVVSHDAGAGGFYRTRDRRAPHNVYGTPATFLSQADAGHTGSPPPELVFARDAATATAAAVGAPLTRISVVMSTYSNPVWSWDPAAGAFLRSEGGTAAVSASGTRLSAANVVVLTVPIVNTAFKDPAGAPVPETQVIGSGAALVASGGKSVAATWSKADALSPLVLTAADGTPVTLVPGNTWVELMPTTGGVTVG